MSEIARHSIAVELEALERAAEASIREFWALQGLALVKLSPVSYFDCETGRAVWAFGNVVRAERRGRGFVYDPNGDPMTPDEARTTAASLLAAALYAEGAWGNR